MSPLDIWINKHWRHIHGCWAKDLQDLYSQYRQELIQSILVASHARVEMSDSNWITVAAAQEACDLAQVTAEHFRDWAVDRNPALSTPAQDELCAIQDTIDQTVRTQCKAVLNRVAGSGGGRLLMREFCDLCVELVDEIEVEAA